MCQQPNQFEIVPSEDEIEYFEEDSSDIQSLQREEVGFKGEAPSSDNRRNDDQSC